MHAAGFGVQPKQPLVLSSQQVRSVSPDLTDLFGSELEQSTAPIYVVGGGKTGMETAYSLIKRFPDRRVRLLIGAGTLFMARDDAFPAGLRRHFAGAVGGDIFRDLASLFNGDNDPMHRRLLTGIRLMRFQKRHPDHLRKALDRVRQRFDIRLGPLPA